ncbi:MAG TPA: histidine kinase [Nocardioides sp.]|uniref:sensor histidine kinase n=1 Tax=Nocardioides sp. TaxID=35761 RepID=UPI002E356721|nr:histidine kinase [Nocardioides sp.]HEX5086818.1 histidine kinase [Nocardioides sp.]
MDTVLGWSAAGGWLHRHPRWADAGYASVVAALLLPVTARTIWGSSWRPALQVAAVAGVVVAHAALAVRRTAPRATFGIAGAFVLGLALLPPIDPGPGQSGPFSAVFVPSVLVFPVALYTVAAWCSRRVSLLALVVSSAGGVVVAARLWGADYLTVAQPGVATSDDPVRSWWLFLVLGVAAMVLLPWWAGRYRRLRLLYVAELEERARRDDAERAAEAGRAVAEERRRIAREMHDVVAHSLSVLVTQAEGGRLMAAKDPAASVRVLDTVARTGREAMQDMAGVLQVLDAPAEASGGPERPQPGLAELPDLVDQVRRSGLPVRYEEHGAPGRLSGTAELAAYRVTQEALTNVLKHAGSRVPTEVVLTWRDGWLEVSVENRLDGSDGCGAGAGLGLRGMEERLSALGGSLQVAATARRFAVLARVPTVAPAGGGPS